MKARPLNKRDSTNYSYYRIRGNLKDFYRLDGLPIRGKVFQKLIDGVWKRNYAKINYPNSWIPIPKEEII